MIFIDLIKIFFHGILVLVCGAVVFVKRGGESFITQNKRP